MKLISIHTRIRKQFLKTFSYCFKKPRKSDFSEENPLTFVGRKIISTTKYNVSLKMAKTYMQIALKIFIWL